MVFKGSLYILNIICGMIPCEYKHEQPDTTSSDLQTLENQFNYDYEANSLNFDNNTLKNEDQKFINDNKTHPLIVKTTSGKVKGYWMRVVGGRKIRAFEGIKYAEPPINERRFRAPAPVKSWNGILQANLKGPKCLQYNDISSSRVIGSENCLFLNVYTKMPSSNKNSTRKYPVIVFIHGGGFLTGSGNDFGPAYLLQRDVVLVTFNHRLGILGFMSTNDEESTGNAGLKDQAEAINWVHNNIENFHGDPNRITLFGHGSGGASVHFHMMSFQARGKFIAGISISGTAFNQWALHTKDQALNLTKAFARSVHCPVHGSTKHTVSCLRKKRGSDLVKMQIAFLDKWPLPLSLFRPVVEEEYQKEDPFISESPEEAYQKGTVDKIPWICGQAEDEGYTFLLSHVALGTFGDIRKRWNSLAPDFFNYNDLPIDQDEITRRLNWLYFRHINPASAPIKTYSDALGARLIYSGIHKALQAHSQHAETYAFMFGYNGKYNLATAAGIKSTEWAVGHGEILGYIFNSTNMYTGFQKKDSELVLSKILVNLFFNFADKQIPGFTTESGENFHVWNAVSDPRNITFLHIDKKIKMIPEPYLQQTLYWESLGLPDGLPLANYSNEIQNVSTAPAAKGFVSTDITVTGNAVPHDLIPPSELKPLAFSNSNKSIFTVEATTIHPSSSLLDLDYKYPSFTTAEPIAGRTAEGILLIPEMTSPTTSTPPQTSENPTTTKTTIETTIETTMATTATTTTPSTIKPLLTRWLAQNFVPMPDKALKMNPTSPTATTTTTISPGEPFTKNVPFYNLYDSNFYMNNNIPHVPFGISIPIISTNSKGEFITKSNFSTNYLKTLGIAQNIPGNHI